MPSTLSQKCKTNEQRGVGTVCKNDFCVEATLAVALRVNGGLRRNAS